MNTHSRFAGLLQKTEGYFLVIIGLSLAIFHIWTSYFGALASYEHRIIHLILAMMLVALGRKFRVKVNSPGLKLTWDVFCVTVLAVIGIYGLSIADIMWKQTGTMSDTDVILSTFLIAMLLYFTWVEVGPALPILAVICIVFAMAGPYMPENIAHRGYSWSRICELLFKGVNGIFGTSLGVSAIYVSIFIIFAALLESSGAGDVFIKLTQSLLGGFRGGPAKVAVVASALFGTISGSAVANVVGTGSFTIPLMKRSGFRPEFAGAVETAASSGGQLMPPVMGAAAFIMADFLGSYNTVVLAAIIPAIIFYAALFIMIDLESLKHKLHGQPRAELPLFFVVLRHGWYLILPLCVLMYLLVVVRYSPQKSAFFSILLLMGVSFFSPEHRDTVVRRAKKFTLNLAASSSGMTGVALVTATSGIIVGILMLTGTGYRLSSILIDISGGHAMVLLFLTMTVCLVLGMGMPTSGAYILLATLIVPALTDLGIPLISAHFFVFYFGIMANITPPVAIAAYTAAGIANSDAMRTGFIAWRLSLAGFLLPFMFCLDPALLGYGTPGQIAYACFICALGTFVLSCALQRYFYGALPLPLASCLLFGALCMLYPGYLTDILGCVISICGLGWQFFRTSRARKAAAGG